MEVRIKREDVWYPNWNGNLDLPESERVAFHHGFLTVEDRDRFQYLKPATQGQLMTGKGLDREWIQDGKGIAKAVVTKIDNLTVVDGSTKNKVDTIEKFYAQPDAFEELPMLLEAHLLDVTARIAESKNLTSGSDAGSSSTTTKPRPSGEAESAD